VTTRRATAPLGGAGRTGRGTIKKTVQRGRPVVPAVRQVRIRELDPFARCGPDTSVEQLFRVDESLDGRPTVHLVFLDRHGWYCYHGRSCPAVTDVHREFRIRPAAATNTALRARA
jgi:hypothetical protein